MSTLRPSDQQITPPAPSEPPRLPLRWAIIAMVAAAAAAAAHSAGGPVAAITTGIAMIVAGHQVLD
ncbi:hypothetical protein [Micromonospora sp. NPDC005172]|uniref:hypothetical protein n=1 Tax=Micromonospora sp. NPDC005172 TaxID=3156867 RepID=UPI0033A3F06C